MEDLPNIPESSQVILPPGAVRILQKTPSTAPLAELARTDDLFKKDLYEEILPNIHLLKTPNGKFIQTNILTLSTKFHLLNNLKYLPDYQIINERMFDFNHGGNYGNFEFLPFLNFYGKEQILGRPCSISEKKTHIICTKETRTRLEQIWQETYTGPTLENLLASGLEAEFASGLYAECCYFAEKDEHGQVADMSHFITFHIFDDSGRVELEDGLSVELADSTYGNYKFYYHDWLYFAKARTAVYRRPVTFSEYTPVVVKPHKFGTTVVGGGNGFTPQQQTTTFVHWQNTVGNLVDGPEFLFHVLDRDGIDIRRIERIFLTHNHADHMSFLYWLLPYFYQSSKSLEIWTTPVIMNSALRVLAAVTGVSPGGLEKILKFKPIEPGTKYDLPEGGAVEIDYGLHSIPALKVKFTLSVQDYNANATPILRANGKPQYRELEISYSGDTHYDPDLTLTMVKDGSMSSGRKDAVDDFIKTSDAIFHEIGGLPLHTDVQPIRELPSELRQKIFGYHNTPEFIWKAQVNVAHQGLTIGVVDTPCRSDFEIVLELLHKSPFFHDLSMFKLQEIAKIAQRMDIQKGERIVTQGQLGDNFYLIGEGYFDVYSKGLGYNIVRLHAFDTFGEAAFTHNPRMASVFAVTDGILYALDAESLSKIVSTRLLQRIAESQLKDKPFIDSHDLFRYLPHEDRQHIALKATKQNFTEGQVIVEIGRPVKGFAIIAEGEATAQIPDVNQTTGKANLDAAGNPVYVTVGTLGDHNFFGEMSLVKHTLPGVRVVASSKSAVVYFLDEETFHGLMESSPAFSNAVTETIRARDDHNRTILEHFLGKF